MSGQQAAVTSGTLASGLESSSKRELCMAATDQALADTSAGPIEYRIQGSGPAVLVLKVGHSSRRTRLGHERLAAHGFTVVDPSRPGYDRTPACVARSAQEAADALAALLDSLAIADVAVVAISAAGHTAIELARRHPNRVRRVSFECARALPWDARTRLSEGSCSVEGKRSCGPSCERDCGGRRRTLCG